MHVGIYEMLVFASMLVFIEMPYSRKCWYLSSSTGIYEIDAGIYVRGAGIYEHADIYVRSAGIYEHAGIYVNAGIYVHVGIYEMVVFASMLVLIGMPYSRKCWYLSSSTGIYEIDAGIFYQLLVFIKVMLVFSKHWLKADISYACA